MYFFVENEFLQNPNSDDKFSRDSGTRKYSISRYSFTKTKRSNEPKIICVSYNIIMRLWRGRAFVYDNARAVVAYFFIREIFFGFFCSRRTAKKKRGWHNVAGEKISRSEIFSDSMTICKTRSWLDLSLQIRHCDGKTSGRGYLPHNIGTCNTPIYYCIGHQPE